LIDYLSGKELPGVKALEISYKKFNKWFLSVHEKFSNFF
jgi:hypothetical protein